MPTTADKLRELRKYVRENNCFEKILDQYYEDVKAYREYGIPLPLPYDKYNDDSTDAAEASLCHQRDSIPYSVKESNWLR